MMLCPCCRQPLPTGFDLVISLDANTAVARGHLVTLPPQQAVIAHELSAAWPNTVSYGLIMDALWGKKRHTEPTDPNMTMRSQVSKLRKALEPLSYGIVPVWHEGYRLVDQQLAGNIHRSSTIGVHGAAT